MAADSDSRAVRSQPWWVRVWPTDVLLATFVGVAQVCGTYAATRHRGGSIDAFGFVLLAVGSAALVARRRYPVGVLAVAFVTTLWYWSASYSRGPIFLALIVAFGTAMLTGHRKAAVASLGLGYVLFLWLPAAVGTHAAPSLYEALGLAAWMLALLAGAELLRIRKQRALAVARGREEEALRRASEERMAMARDLHDVLAHGISLINVQANTALHLMDRQPERARSALSTINEVSREALAELRSVLGVLRQVDEGVPRSPVPGLARLEDLIRRVEVGGLEVRLERSGDTRPLPTGVDLAAYRIIQEALTNAARHSGGSRATVRIATGEEDVVVEVDDDGRNVAVPSGAAGGSQPGRGIAGMKERAAALGGTVQVGPRPGGGYRVRAWLPLDGAKQ